MTLINLFLFLICCNCPSPRRGPAQTHRNGFFPDNKTCERVNLNSVLGQKMYKMREKKKPQMCTCSCDQGISEPQTLAPKTPKNHHFSSAEQPRSDQNWNFKFNFLIFHLFSLAPHLREVKCVFRWIFFLKNIWPADKKCEFLKPGGCSMSL